MLNSLIYGMIMLTLPELGEQIADRRRALKLTQPELAKRAGIGRSTLAALEGGKLAELGFTKIAMILAVLGLDLKLSTFNSGRPTFDDLKAESMLDA